MSDYQVCPLLCLAKNCVDPYQNLQCLKERCAWWFRTEEVCGVLGMAWHVRGIRDEMEDAR